MAAQYHYPSSPPGSPYGANHAQYGLPPTSDIGSQQYYNWYYSQPRDSRVPQPTTDWSLYSNQGAKYTVSQQQGPPMVDVHDVPLNTRMASDPTSPASVASYRHQPYAPIEQEHLEQAPMSPPDDYATRTPEMLPRGLLSNTLSPTLSPQGPAPLSLGEGFHTQPHPGQDSFASPSSPHGYHQQAFGTSAYTQQHTLGGPPVTVGTNAYGGIQLATGASPGQPIFHSGALIQQLSQPMGQQQAQQQQQQHQAFVANQAIKVNIGSVDGSPGPQAQQRTQPGQFATLPQSGFTPYYNPAEQQGATINAPPPAGGIDSTGGMQGKRGGRNNRGNPANTQQRTDRPNVPKSAKLTEFLQNPTNNKTWQLSDIKGHVVEFSQDQDGSRFIQRRLEESGRKSQDITMVFEEVIEQAQELMIDVFGNYVIQKMFDMGSPEQRKIIASKMSGIVVKLTLQTYGCRVVQKALDTLPHAEQEIVANELDGSVPRCVQDQNGNHVIQKCIEAMPDRSQFIIMSFVGRVPELATHAYGCRVLQRIFEHCKDPMHVRPVVDEVMKYLDTLVIDQYGNYVVQHVLINSPLDVQMAMIRRLKSRICEYSQGKFSSNVAEKVFSCASTEAIDLLIEEITTPRPSGLSDIVVMMQDQYANYVVQRLLDGATPQQQSRLADHVRPQVQTIRRYTYGKHIISRIEKMGLLTPTKGSPTAASPNKFRQDFGSSGGSQGSYGGHGGGFSHGGGGGGGGYRGRGRGRGRH